MMKFELNSLLRDSVTGLQGRATGRCEWLNQEPTYCIEPLAEQGTKATWVAESRLEARDQVAAEGEQ